MPFVKTFATIVFLTLSGPVFSQDGNIKGHLLPQNDQVDFAGIEIQLSQENCLVKGAIIDPCGEFQILNIKPGKYSVQLLASGKIAYDDVILIEHGKTERVNFSHPGSSGQSE